MLISLSAEEGLYWCVGSLDFAMYSKHNEQVPLDASDPTTKIDYFLAPFTLLL